MTFEKHILDEPIERAEQDVLNRIDFANSVADLILTAPQGSCSQIIGLYGKWGEGKTSLKNMVLEAYKARCKLPPLVVEFSPWTYTKPERLPFLFFCGIAHEFGLVTNDEKAEKLETQFKQFGQILEIASLVPQLTLFSLWLKPVLEFFKAKYADQTNDLSSTRQQIHDLMSDEPRRLIVVIDDLDRITAAEVRRMIQLVKANGDFPNITYLLLCDREYVGRALCASVDGYTAKDGCKYLEKIVNFGLDLPRIRSTDQRNYFLLLLNDILKRHAVTEDEFNPSLQLSPIVLDLVHNVRDVKRLLADFEFQLSMHRDKGKGIASVNLDDLITLEALRLFEPDFFHAIYQQKETLLCENSNQYISVERKISEIWFEQHLIKFMSDRHKPLAKEFIVRHLGWHYNKYQQDSDYKRDELREAKLQFRLAHPDCFERYFNLYSDPSEFSKSDLMAFPESLATKDKAVNELRKLFDLGRLRSFLEIIESSFAVADLAQQENYIAAMTLAAEFSDDSQSRISTPSATKIHFSLSTQIHRCVRFFCDRVISRESRSSILLKIFKQEESVIVLPVSILSSDHASRVRNAAISQLLMDSDYEELKKLCLDRIEERQVHGKLIDHIDERDIRLMWTKIGVTERIRELLVPDFRSYPSVMHALLPFVGISSSSEGTFYTICLDELEKYTDPDNVLAILKDQLNLKNGEAGIRDSLAFSIESKRNNKPYDHKEQLRSVYNQEI